MTPPERLQDVTLAEVVAEMRLYGDSYPPKLREWADKIEAAALSVRGWLPIESAPTNKPVLLWNNETQELRDQVGALRQAIRLTLEENAHLADGEVCTLSRLKDALGET